MNVLQKTSIANALFVSFYVVATSLLPKRKNYQTFSPLGNAMSKEWRLGKTFSTFGLILILTLGLNMNAQAQLFGIGGKTMSWKEEVLLHDGQIIIAERFYNLGGYSTIDSTERAVVDQTVTFSLPED
jgi:hypothetical protein